MSTDKYQNPLVSRYASAEMSYVDIEREAKRQSQGSGEQRRRRDETDKQSGRTAVAERIREQQSGRSRESECTLATHAHTPHTPNRLSHTALATAPTGSRSFSHLSTDV